MQQRFSEIAQNAAQSELLLPEASGYLEPEGIEKTYKITQNQLKEEVDITTAQKVIRGTYVSSSGIFVKFACIRPLPDLLHSKRATPIIRGKKGAYRRDGLERRTTPLRNSSQRNRPCSAMVAQ